MPAQISSNASPVAQAIQNILAAGTPADAAGAPPASFAALIAQLAGQPLVADADAEAALQAQGEAAPTGTRPEDVLGALLPFLEGMGLTQAARQVAAAGKADSNGDGAQAEIAPLASSPGAAGTAISAAADDSAEQALATDEVGIALLADERQPRGKSDFAAQLVAAIEGSKEQPRTPGSTAAAAHEVIATAGPQALAAPSAANVSSVPSLPVAPAVGATHWNEAVGNQIVWMANRGESRAELVLTPPQMGRVEVSLTISGEQASASFVSASPAVREALEAALPRLREVLADAGIQLGQAQVSAENPRQTAQQEKNTDNPGFERDPQAGPTPAGNAAGPARALAGLKSGRGLVDVFA